MYLSPLVGTSAEQQNSRTTTPSFHKHINQFPLPRLPFNQVKTRGCRPLETLRQTCDEYNNCSTTSCLLPQPYQPVSIFTASPYQEFEVKTLCSRRTQKRNSVMLPQRHHPSLPSQGLLMSRQKRETKYYLVSSPGPAKTTKSCLLPSLIRVSRQKSKAIAPLSSSPNKNARITRPSPLPKQDCEDTQ